MRQCAVQACQSGQPYIRCGYHCLHPCPSMNMQIHLAQCCTSMSVWATIKVWLSLFAHLPITCKNPPCTCITTRRQKLRSPRLLLLTIQRKKKIIDPAQCEAKREQDRKYTHNLACAEHKPAVQQAVCCWCTSHKVHYLPPTNICVGPGNIQCISSHP